jgi:serine/threonine protein kinase
MPSLEPQPYTYVGLLGEGGFGVVSEYRRADGARFALKRIRAQENASFLDRERDVLAALADARVPRVPTLCKTVISSPNQLGQTSLSLLLSPVGLPLLEFVRKCDAAQRARVAGALWAQLHDTLSSAHAARILHCDVRPSNIVVVRRTGADAVADASADAGADASADAPEDLDFILVDWGVSVRDGAPRARRELFGVPAFMADELVRIWSMPPSTQWTPSPAHDFHALAYTCAAVVAGGNAEPPWSKANAGDADTMLQERRSWITSNISDARVCGVVVAAGAAAADIASVVAPASVRPAVAGAGAPFNDDA